MAEQIRIQEIKPINLEGGYVIDGFPSVGFTNAIATESMIHTSPFKLVAFLDSEHFPPLSIIKDGLPNHSTNIFVNSQLKVGVFSSYLTLHESLHRVAAKTMLNWAKKHKCSLVISSVATKPPMDTEHEIIGAASTETAKTILNEVNIPILSHGVIPGIPGLLLIEGRYTNQNVVVLIFNPEKEEGPDFKSGAKLCKAISKLIPGASCNMRLLEKEAKVVEQDLQEAEKETKSLADSMYR
jgi:uncharacterized protein